MGGNSKYRSLISGGYNLLNFPSIRDFDLDNFEGSLDYVLNSYARCRLLMDTEHIL